jgi:CubicO group peptidase (beta-lactamase class C family)
MTVHQLLTHSSGLMHWPDMAGLDIADPPSSKEILEQATKLPLRFPPGASWAYSGVGYLLAAAIIEAASGQTYAVFAADNIFGPLGMASTTSGLTQQGVGVASGYRDGQPVLSVPGLAGLPGTGDLWTTVTDLIHYGNAVCSGALLSQRSWQLMSQPHTIIDEGGSSRGSVSKSASGYGMFLGTISGQRVQYHPGDNPGFRSILAWLPDVATTIAVLSNEESASLDDIVLGLLPNAQ